MKVILSAIYSRKEKYKLKYIELVEEVKVSSLALASPGEWLCGYVKQRAILFDATWIKPVEIWISNKSFNRATSDDALLMITSYFPHMCWRYCPVLAGIKKLYGKVMDKSFLLEIEHRDFWPKYRPIWSPKKIATTCPASATKNLLEHNLCLQRMWWGNM
jgi:hypothetical protein